MQQELRRLAHRPHEQQQAGERQRALRIEPEETEALPRRTCGEGLHLREDDVETGGTEQIENEENAERKTEIADPVDHKGLHCRRIGRFLLIPESDQQVARKADTLPAKEHLHQIVGSHQHQHGKGEQRQIGEKARAGWILVHVTHRIEMHERRDAVDDDEHHDGQRINAQGPVHGEIARDHPVGNPHRGLAVAITDGEQRDP